jgi:hypothetical protein
MYFASGHSGGHGGADIWVSCRSDATDDFGWGTPVNLGSTINSSVPESDPFYYVDPNTGQVMLFFSRNNYPGGQGDWDIFVSVMQSDGTWGTVGVPYGINTAARETRPILRSDGLELIFSSNRDGGSGGIDIWHTTRSSTYGWTSFWATPTNVAELNTAQDDRAPFFGDDYTLYFSSNRTGSMGGDDAYITTRSSF